MKTLGLLVQKLSAEERESLVQSLRLWSCDRKSDIHVGMLPFIPIHELLYAMGSYHVHVIRSAELGSECIRIANKLLAISK